MRREDLVDLNAFLAVAEECNFTRAAARLGTSQSSLSHTIRRLEARLGVRLLTRTTRNVSVTEAGQKLVDTLEVQHKQEGIDAAVHQDAQVNIAFVPIAMPSTAGPGTIAMIISTASTVKTGDFPAWVLHVAPVLTFVIVAVILWLCLRSSGAIMRLVGKGGIEAISRLMGFLLVCMGVQFIINGVLEIIKTYH